MRPLGDKRRSGVCRMGKAQRTKGASGERELAGLLADHLGVAVKRKLGQARDGGDDIETPPFRWEVKRRKAIAVHEFMEQITAACGPGDIPIVAMRGDGKEWLVMLRLTDALPLVAGELKQEASE